MPRVPRRQQHDQPRIERSHNLDAIAKIVKLHCIDAGRQARVIIAAPAGDLGTFDRRHRMGIGLVDRLGPGRDGAREGDIHPLLEIGPCREIVVRPLHGFARRHRCDLFPAIELGSPFSIERRQAAIALLQPVPHRRERCLGEVEIPECRQVGNAGFVAEIIIERPVGLQCADITAEPIVDVLQPTAVGQTGLTNKRRRIEGIFPIALLDLEKFPVHWKVARPSMVGRIEIGRDVFEIAPQIIGEQRIEFVGEVGPPLGTMVAFDHPRGNAEPFQSGIADL